MKPFGYLVIEKCEDYEQPLGLDQSPGMPPGGVLEWTDSPRAVFADRKAARSAITRTEHYRQAFSSVNHPEAKLCKIVPLSLISP